VAFWLSPNDIDITKRVDFWWALLRLAFLYLKLGLLLEHARALIINGAFTRQCRMLSIDYIKELCGSAASSERLMKKLPHFAEGVYAAESTEKMESFITRYASFAHPSSKSKKDLMGHVTLIQEDFNSTKKSHKRQVKTEGKNMKLLFTDGDAAGGGRQVFDILSSTILKIVFTDYAKKRGVSLRSLRFSCNEKTLFLSQIGNKAPEELGMQDGSVIVVHDTGVPQAPQEKRSTCPSKKGKKGATKSTHQARQSNARRAKHQGGGDSTKQEVTTKIGMTHEELKVKHSKMLTKIHEELQPKLLAIRRRLNDLLIERTQPKYRPARRHPNNASRPAQLWVDNPYQPCISGKAGNPCFIVQVGDAENLYKTRKFSSCSPGNTPALDLHGHTENEALAKLDENLHRWVDTAMQGSYPFVIQVKIICGCGSQSLRKVVEDWIKSKSNVSNAPQKR